MNLQLKRGRWHVASDRDIANPFLMTIVGASDHWLFVSSTGALTAGRTNADQAIFAYETEDRLHRAAGQVGPVTAFRVQTAEGSVLWRPFDVRRPEGVVRSIAKRTLGDAVRFEEANHRLGLTFSYTWSLSNTYGFVRHCELRVEPDRAPLRVEMVDGLRALLPHGVGCRTQQAASVLVDAYKHAELLRDGAVGVYALTSMIVDRPEPAEALRCTVAYLHGLAGAVSTLDEEAFEAFCAGARVPDPQSLRLGATAGYFVHASFELTGGDAQTWLLGADIGWDAARVRSLCDDLARPGVAGRIEASIDENRNELVRLVARADGLQSTAHAIRDDRHATNAMFNCMRGGVIPADTLDGDDVRDFLRVRNPAVADAHAAALAALGEHTTLDQLWDMAARTGDLDLIRLCTEYLPLTFSRRHGDPSRPWNSFNIRVQHPDGSRRYNYEGNWRDVFQNWEGLLTSFPEYIEAAWTVFFNATTADGHNPYRITRDGMDWERPDPDDPWAHIGYWGDHQIIYSLKLLELCEQHQPGLLARRLTEPRYVYADVPYRIASYEEILANPHHTITFDHARDRAIELRVESIGADGRLLHDAQGRIVRGTLAEKLLISLLAKLGNFVADGGIWMNTQRPEWNDANNALVGNGLSVVTLAYMVRHLRFLATLFGDRQDYELHDAVATWIEQSLSALESYASAAREPDRRALLDALGQAASRYRGHIYEHGLQGTRPASRETIARLLDVSGRLLARTLRACQREDGLFHAYNLLDTRGGAARVSTLDAMLEGQVAALSSGELAPEEAIALVDQLFQSPLYRSDQHTFLLYPAKDLPRFLDRGVIPSAAVAANPLLRALADDPTSGIVTRDLEATYRFGGDLRNAHDLDEALSRLAEASPARYEPLVRAHRADALDVWESVFSHRAYTGRSGSMYGYEGLGSVYWHMVSKLNLAMLECTVEAHDRGVDQDLVREMARCYYRLRSGLGDYKTFREYGAFPTDAYSHTPPNGGARQPGMTGQVKEDLLTRRGELGVRVVDGCLRFDPFMLRPEEFVREPTAWTGLGVDDTGIEIPLVAGQLAFTVCQVPVVYTLIPGADVTVEVARAEGARQTFAHQLGPELSRAIFGRRSRVARIDVAIGADRILS